MEVLLEIARQHPDVAPAPPQADAFAPRPGVPPLPFPSPYTTNLVENVVRLRLDVGRVAHVHGRSRFVGHGLEGRGPLDNKLVIRPFDHSI